MEYIRWSQGDCLSGGGGDKTVGRVGEGLGTQSVLEVSPSLVQNY